MNEKDLALALITRAVTTLAVVRTRLRRDDYNGAGSMLAQATADLASVAQYVDGEAEPPAPVEVIRGVPYDEGADLAPGTPVLSQALPQYAGTVTGPSPFGNGFVRVFWPDLNEIADELVADLNRDPDPDGTS